MIKLFSNLFLFSIAICSTKVFAVPLYSSCNPVQVNMLIKEFKLISNKTLETNDLSERSDCIQINSENLLITTANSIPNKENIYQLQLYLIDAKNKNIVLKYQHPQTISEENGRFSSIKFDRVPYSTLPNENIIGLNIHHYNMGEYSYDLNRFNLFRIQSNTNTKPYKIQWILRNIQTNLQSSWRPAYSCENGTTEDVKSIFILQKNQSHQLQDILLKQTKKSEDTDEKCKTTRSYKAEQQFLKFNGEFYQLNRKQLLTSEDIKDE